MVKIEKYADSEDSSDVEIIDESVFRAGCLNSKQSSRAVRRNEETTGENLPEMDKTNHLLQMGFSEDEILTAIDNFGPEVPIDELVDSIFARRIASNVVTREENVSNGYGNTILQNQNGSSCPDDAATGSTTERHQKHCCHPDINPSCSNSKLCDSKRLKRERNCKHLPVDNKASCSSNCPYNDNNGSAEARFNIERLDQLTPNLCGAASHAPSQTPYFFYGNVVEISQDMWSRLSQFLYQTEPEFADSQFFSALIRKEGYIHNLPTKKRFHVRPALPMTLDDALPHTKEWWPSWDMRRKLCSINSETSGSHQLCEQLGKILIYSQGMPSEEQKLNIIHQRTTMNLIWVGQNKLRPIKPEEVEKILGYCKHHTDFDGVEPASRLRVLKHSFQTDTLGYHLSGLKVLYPDGLRVLSIYSGIGGAEVALDKLGIHLNLIVSVETSKTNQRILKRWWRNSGQSGILEQIEAIEMLTTKKLEGFIERFGGFDIVIGANPCNAFEDPEKNVSGVNLMFSFEFLRVFQRVRDIMKTKGLC